MAAGYKITHNEKLKLFEYTNGTETAFIEYKMRNKSIALLHTIVPDAISGKGVAAALAAYAFNYAKENSMPVIVLCSYINSYVKRHPGLTAQLDPEIHFNN